MGGGAGGGGSQGEIDFPEYMKTKHGEWLGALDTLIGTAHAINPHATWDPYDPTGPLAELWGAICAYNTVVDGLDYTDDWGTAFTSANAKVSTVLGSDPTLSTVTALMATLYGKLDLFYDDISAMDPDALWTSAHAVVSSAYSAAVTTPSWDTPDPAAEDAITSAANAFSSAQGDILDADILPRFRRGMQDLNAVNTSTFTTGQAIMLAFAQRDTAKFQADLRAQAFLEKDRILAQDIMEKNRMLTELELKKRTDYASYVLQGTAQILGLDRAKVEMVGQYGDLYNKASSIEADSIMKDNALDVDLDIAKKKIRTTFLTSSIDRMLASLMTRVEYERGVAQLVTEYEKIQIQVWDAYYKTDLETNVDDAEWDLKIYNYAANMMASISGAAVSANPDKKSSPLLGIIGGGMQGAMMGSSFGPWGMIIGGIMGALGGLFM